MDIQVALMAPTEILAPALFSARQIWKKARLPHSAAHGS